MVQRLQSRAVKYRDTLSKFERDVQAYSEGHIPRHYQHKQHVQVHKDQDGLQQEADANMKARSKQDFQLHLKSTHSWLVCEQQALTPAATVKEVLPLLYEYLIDKHFNITSHDAQMIRRHVSATLLNKARHASQAQQRAREELAAKKTKEEKETQLLADRHDQFAQEYPQAALAIYVREVETRILAVVGQLILDKGGDPVGAYSNARKGQQLSVLESKAHALKSVLRSKNYPCLPQKSLVGFVKKICVQAGHYSSRARSTSKS